MRKILSIKVLLILLLAFTNLPGKEIVPVFYPQKITLEISGKRRGYYILDVKDPLVYEIEGPRSIRIISRIDGVEHGSHSYRFLYSIDGEEPRFLYYNRGRVSEVTQIFGTEEPVSVGNDLILQVPSGKHKYYFFNSYRNENRVFVRVVTYIQKKRDSRKRYKLQPANSPEVVKLKSDGKLLEYYLLTRDNPIEIVPPQKTELVIFSRLQFEYWMDEPANYRLQLRRGKRILRTWQLATRKSTVTTYEGKADKIPGQYKKVFYSVPAREDTLTLRLLDRDKTVLVKFRYLK